MNTHLFVIQQVPHVSQASSVLSRLAMPLKGRRVFVVGVGMTNFTKPRKDPAEGPHYPELVTTAVGRALEDACLDKSLIEQAVVGRFGLIR
jgi:hypothetical protein